MGNILSVQCRRAFFLVAILPFLLPPHVWSQVLPEGGALLDFVAAERQRGAVLTYAQSYIDDQHEKVSYTGTLYTGIHLFRLDGCEVVARVNVEDRYSGAILHKSGLGGVHIEQTGDLTDDTVYEYRFSLGRLNAGEIHDLRAIPAQFAGNTSFRCEEDQSCHLSWVRITSRDHEISETRTVDGIQDINSRVSSIALPMASPEIAANAAKLFAGAAQACAADNR
jgi:hypothetical protein